MDFNIFDADQFRERFMTIRDSDCNLPANSNCRKCGGEMRPGIALAQTCTGVDDFAGHGVVTMSPGGPGKVIDCLKCGQCGHSVSV